MKPPVESKDFFGQTFKTGDYVVCLVPNGYRGLVTGKVVSNANVMSTVSVNMRDYLRTSKVENNSCIRIAPDHPKALAYEKMAEGKKIL